MKYERQCRVVQERHQHGSAGGGTYTVRSGDTLQAIAAALYGDGNLWYRIAEANGLSAGAALSEGQSLILPAGVTKSSHNASTFQPYDASEAMGDTLPTTPKPPKTPKCGAFGQILLVAIAVAVTALTAGTGAPLLAQVGAAMLGSAVSQGVGVALGIQNKFSFKSVALAGISAGITGGLSELSTVTGKGILSASAAKTISKVGTFFKQGNIISDLARGVAGSALSQGVSVATGLQKSFSWTGVAAAGIGAGIAGAASRGLADLGVTGFGNDVGSTMADTIAQAATRSAIKGNSFGDNLLASLPSALGNLAGRALAAGVGTAFDGKGGGGSVLAVVEAKGNITAEQMKAIFGDGPINMGGGPINFDEDSSLSSMFGSANPMDDLLDGIGSDRLTLTGAGSYTNNSDRIKGLFPWLNDMLKFDPQNWGSNDMKVAARFIHSIAANEDWKNADGDLYKQLGQTLDAVIVTRLNDSYGDGSGAAKLAAALGKYSEGYDFDTTLNFLTTFSEMTDGGHQNIFRKGRDVSFGFVAYEKGIGVASLWSAASYGDAAADGFVNFGKGLVETVKLVGDVLVSPFSSDARTRMKTRWDNLTAENVFGPAANGWTQAVENGDFRPLVRGVTAGALSAITGSYASKAAGKIAGKIPKFTVFSAEELMKLAFGGAKPARVLEGTNGKIAVIGRKMDIVNPYADGLKAAQADVEVFSVEAGTMSKRASDKLLDIFARGGRVGPKSIVKTLAYKENVAWAQKMKADGYTIVDLGNPSNQASSAFYSMERKIIFGDRR